MFAAAVILGTSLVAASLAACSDSSSTGGTGADGGEGGTVDAAPPGDTGAGDAASDVGADSGGACNTVVNGAAESTSSTVKSAAPAATGGTITDGTYFQTEFNLFDPNGTASAPSPSGLRVTLVIAGNLMQSVQELGDGSTQTFSETFTVSGTAVNRILTCPKAAPDLQAVFSASGKNLVIYETDPSSKIVAGSVYVKQ